MKKRSVLPLPLLCIVLQAVILVPVTGGIVEQWVRRYDGADGVGDEAYSVVMDNAGSVVVAGFSDHVPGSATSIYTVKYAAADGAPLWEKRIPSFDVSIEAVPCVALNEAGNVHVAGPDYNNGFCYYAGKFNGATGEPQWERRYCSANVRVFRDMAVDNFDRIVLTGYQGNAGGDNDNYLTMQLSGGTGLQNWQNLYSARPNWPEGGGFSYDRPHMISLDLHRNVFISGSLESTISNIGGSVLKLDASTGQVSWNRGSTAGFTSTLMAADSGFTTAYLSEGTNLVRYDEAGIVLWQTNTGAGVSALKVNGPGDVFVLSTTTGGFSVAKYRRNTGLLEWQKSRALSGWISPVFRPRGRLTVDSSGNLIVSGSAIRSGSQDIYTAVYAGSDGSLLNEFWYDTPDHRNDYVSDIAADSSGNFAVTGYSEDKLQTPQLLADYVTIKYGPSTGLTLQQWRQLHFGTSANSGNAADSADPDGDGLANLIEYAFGLDPTSSASLQLPPPLVTGGNFAITFPTPLNVTGITYGADCSTSMAAGTWTPVPDTGTGGTHTFTLPVASHSRCFLRLTVTVQ